MKPCDFIALIGPAAQAMTKTTGIPASFTVAQAALESGWGGSSQLVRQGCNLFGVKADPAWHGDTLVLPTRECIKGQWMTVQAVWRKYPDWQACLQDHAHFLLTNPRYKPAFQFTDGPRFAQAVADAGYATDPAYASKVISIIQGHGLEALDAPKAAA